MSETTTERLKAALNLDREPFSDEGVAGLFFPGGGRQALLDQLIHLCRYGPPLLVLTGDNGVGKTTQIRQLEARLDASVFQYVHIEADVLADESLILQRIAEDFHLDLGPDHDSAIAVLLRYARELDGYSQTPLLIIDEAQNLNASAIDFLETLLASAGRSGLRCLLCMDGHPPEKIPLLAPVLRSELDHQVLELPALDEEAINEYLDYRMTTSGLSDIQFSAEQKRQIRNQSQGNIDRINIVARQILVQHFPYEKNRKKPARLPLLHIAGVTLLAALLVVAYVMVPRLTDEDVGAVTAPPVFEAEPTVRDSALPTVSDEPAVYTSLDEGDADMAPEPATVSATLADSEDSPPAEQSLDSFTSGGEIDFNYVESDEEDDPLQPVLTSEEPVVASGQEAEQVQDAAPEPMSGTSAGSPAAEDEPVVGKSQPVTAADGLTPREKWLMSLDKSQFTLQMLGATEEASVQKFLARYPSLKDIAYYRTTLRDRDWYVVVYGLYASKDAAKQALNDLPKGLRESGPWARSVESVQQEIRKRND